MRIVKFTAENVKKLKAVEITPGGSVVEITGPNGSGKTSVLDAIWYAFQGGAVIPNKVVRQGEEKAFVKLDLGELVVTRRFQSNGNTSLLVEAASGARFPSPQRMLDELVGALSFDPLEFTRMEPRVQLEALRKVVTIDTDIDALDRETRGLSERRTDLNRDLRQAKARLDGESKPTGEPEASVNVAALMDEIQKAGKVNEDRVAERDRREKLKNMILHDEELRVIAWADADKVMREAEEKCLQIMSEAKKQHDAYTHKATEADDHAERIKAELSTKVPVLPNVETGPLVQCVREAEAINKRVAQRALYSSMARKAEDLSTVVEGLALKIDEIVATRAAAIARAAMPVEGLSFGEGEVLYQGLPLTNASSAEQLRVSAGIAMAANPKLRVLRVKDGSLLDEASLKLLSALTEAADFQLWIERVEESDQRPCIIMDDGSVRAKEGFITPSGSVINLALIQEAGKEVSERIMSITDPETAE